MYRLPFILAILHGLSLIYCLGQAPDLKAGFNASTILTSVNAGNGVLPGFYLGVAASKALGDKTSFGVEFVYSLQGARADDQKAKYSYLNLPLLFSYKLNDKIGFHIGPQVGMIFNAVLKGKVEENITPKLNAMDLALVGGLTFPITDFFKIESRINFGLSNTVQYPVPDGSYRNLVLQLGGVFSFRKRV